MKDKAIAVATQRKENKQEVRKRMEKGVKKSGGRAATCEKKEDGNLLIKAHSEHQWEQATFHFIEEKTSLFLAWLKRKKKKGSTTGSRVGVLLGPATCFKEAKSPTEQIHGKFIEFLDGQETDNNVAQGETVKQF